MSQTIDQKVVEMRFDNKNFENNVSTTMSTLDKLKQKLHFGDAGKSLDGVAQSAKKIDMSTLSNGVETVRMKFSALDVMATTALANITNSAVNAGKRIVSSLTIQPVSDGFKEYELMLNSIQTTMAGTGKTAEEVEEELKRLDEYADKTVYSTADMLNNLPKFTNAGVDLEKATTAMIGIANATAHAGGDASKASIAFYNLGQAIGTGYLTRMDYNSINNAGIATMEWKNQMVDAAIAAGTLKKVGEDSYQAGNKTLTLQQLFIDGLQEQWATTDVMMKVFGDYGDEQTEIGKKAYAAAQDIKTYTMMMESLKATAGTGWKDTWQIIFGNLNDAKVFWTGLTNFISGIITKMDDARNRVLTIALKFTEPWKAITDKLNGLKKVTDTVNKVTGTLEYFQDVVNRVWMGEFNNWGDNPDRRDLLAAAGYDQRVVQYLVNLGEESWHANKVYQLSMEEIEAAHKHFGLEFVATEESVADANAQTTESVYELDDAKLKDLGLTEDEIKLYRALESEAKRCGISMEELAEEMSSMNGRDRLIESFKNLGSAIGEVFRIAKDAYKEIFNPPGVEELGIRLFGVIKRFQEFTQKIKDSLVSVNEEDGTRELTDKGEKLMSVFKGIFAAIHAVYTLLSGPVKIIFNIIKGLFEALDIPILDVAASLGDALVAFDAWLSSVLDFKAIWLGIFDFFKNFSSNMSNFWDWLKNTKIVKAAMPLIDALVNRIKSIYAAVKETKAFKAIASFFQPFLDGIKSWWAGLKEADNIPKYLFEGLWNGIKNGASKIWDGISNVIVNLIEIVKNLLGIHSPSKVFMVIGGFIVSGLLMGILNMFPEVKDTLSGLFDGLTGFIGEIDWDSIIGGAMGAGSTVALIGLYKTLSGAGSLMDGIGDMVDDIGRSIRDISKGIKADLKAEAFKTRMEAISEIIKSLVILAAAVFVLGKFCTPGELAQGVIGIVALGGVVVAMTWLLEKVSKSSIKWKKGKGLDINGMQTTILRLGVALLIMAIAVKKMGEMAGPDFWQGIGGIALMVVAIVGIFALLGLTVKGETAKNIDKFGQTMVKMSIALLLMVYVVKLASNLSEDQLKGAVPFLLGFLSFFFFINLIALMPSKNIDKIGGMLVKITIALLLMVAVFKLTDSITPDETAAGIAFLKMFLLFVAALMAISLIGGNKIQGLGTMLLGVGVAMLIMVWVIDLVGDMSPEQLAKGITAIATFGTMIAALILVTGKSGGTIKAAGTIIAFAAAIAILAVVAILCSLISTEGLIKGISAVGALSTMMALMIAATKNSKNCVGNIMAIVLAIAIMVAGVAILAGLDTENVAVAGSVVAGLSAMLAVLIGVSGKAKKAVGGILAIAGLLVVLTGALILLSYMNPLNLIVSAIALGGLMFAMVGVLNLLLPIGKKAKTAQKGAIALGVLAVSLMLFVGALALMDGVENAITNAIVLSALTAAMVGLLALLIPIGKKAKTAQKGAIALAWLAVPLILFAGTLLLMSGAEKAIPNAIALGLLTAVMVGVMALLIPLAKKAKSAQKGALALAVLAAPLALFAGVLLLMSGAENTIVNAIALGILITVMVGVLALVGLIEPLVKKAYAGILALLLLAIPLLAIVGIIYLLSGIDGASKIMLSLAGFLLVISATLVVLALVGMMIVPALLGIAALLVLFIALGALMIGVGALVTECPKIKEFLDVGIPIMIQLAHGIGSMIGALIEGFMSAIAAGLPAMGQALSDFMINATPFIEGCKMVDGDVIAGAGILAGAIIALTVADLINGLAGLVGCDLPTLGTTLSQFMVNALPFIAGAMMINPAAMEGIQALATAILTLTGAGVLEGLASLLGGGSSIEEFSEQFPVLGQGLKGFSEALADFTAERLLIVQLAAQAVKTLASAAAEIPNTGGLLGSIVGENDLGPFADQFPKLGTGLVGFLTEIDKYGGLTEEKMEIVKKGAEAVKIFSEAAKEIPNSGGWMGAIFGENDMDTFAKMFPVLGEGLVKYLGIVDGKLNEEQMELVNLGAEAVVTFAEAAGEIPNSGGWVGAMFGENNMDTFAKMFPVLGEGLVNYLNWVAPVPAFKDGTAMDLIKMGADAVVIFSEAARAIPNTGGIFSWITGESDLASFAEKFPQVGTGLKGFVENLGTFDDAKIKTVNTGVKAVLAIAELSNSDMENFNDEVEDFSEGLLELGEGLCMFTSMVAAVDKSALQTAIQNTRRLMTLFRDTALIDDDAVETFADNLEDAADIGVEDFIDAIGGSDPRADAKKAGIELLTSVKTGLTDAKTQSSVKGAGTESAAKAIKAFKDRVLNGKDTAKEAGKDFGKGLIKGIEAKQQAVYDAGYALGQKAVQGEKDGQDSNSPSKLAMQNGRWFGEGLVIGIDQMGKKVYNAGYGLGDTATKALSSTISRISEMVSSDIDSQPTIRPVLDLSDVESGTSALAGMLNMKSSIGVRTNIGAISSMMNDRSQNGANSDVISALDKLGKKMDNINNASYTINGITYDDGSNITEAVKTLVRAARIERRV